MSTNRNPEPAPVSLTPADIYFVVFRHKWKIISLTLIGLVAATIFYFTKQPLYQSDAQLLIRYISDSHAQNPSDNNTQVTPLTDQEQNAVNAEMAILCSFDMAAEAATNIGPDKILAKLGGGNDALSAAAVIRSNLKVDNKIASGVIDISFRSPDPDVVRPVLAEIISDYKMTSREVHEAIGITEDALSDDTTKLHMEIAQTEDELRIAKTNAGIISIEDSEKSYEELSTRIQTELMEARGSLAEHETLQELTSSQDGKIGSGTNANLEVPPEKAASYKFICEQLSTFEKKQNDYIQSGFSESNKLVLENRQELVAASRQKADLEKQYPALLDFDTTTAASTSEVASSSVPTAEDESKLAGAQRRKIAELDAEFNSIQAQAAKLDEAEAKISDLEQKKKQQEENYDYYLKQLGQTQINDALGPGRVANIQVIEEPTPVYKEYTKFYRVIAMMVFGGLLAGLAWAFLIEYYLDRTVKRPVDLQSKLRIPFFLSIPDLNHGSRRLPAPDRKQLAFNGETQANGSNGSSNGNGHSNGTLEVASATINHALHSHYDALRDRLVNYFESINLTRKPKLVAVTSTSKGAGVSTISAGLAASLSETGDGRVLLVDMNLENGAARQFVRGKPDCQLDDALASEKRDNALVQENLYVVSEGSNADKLPRILPKRFQSLVPKLRASDYDYIIFDMPPVTQTSVTTRLAGFMDTVMLVVESERTDREVVQQAHQILQQSKANVTAVLNKTRTYIPAGLRHDINADM